MYQLKGSGSNVSTKLFYENRVLDLVISDDGYFDLVALMNHKDFIHDGFEPIVLAKGRINDDDEVEVYAC